MKNKIIAIFMVLMFCFLSFFPFCSVGSSSIVSAAETSWLTPETYYSKGSNCSNALFNSTVEKLKTLFTRNNMVYSNYYIILSAVNNATVDGAYAFVKGNENLSNYNFTSVYDSVTYNVYQSDSVYVISSDLQSISFHQNNNYTLKNGLAYNNILYCSCAFSNNNISSINSSNSYIYISDLSSVPVLEPDPYVPRPTTLYGLDLAINETSFYEWIIDNNKLSELPSYITQTKLLSFISFYNEFGGNFGNFLKNIPDWFSHMNILNQTSENVNILKSSMDRLYQEYLNSFWREIEPMYNELPHHRRNIQTQTTDDDTSLITDDSTDTLDISILRDILRGIIQVSNQIGDGANSIINKLDQLDFTVNLTNGGGSSVTDLSVLYEYDISDFNDDFITFEENVSDITSVPLSYVQTINNNSLMPENMLSDKQSLTVNIPVINGFTVNSDGTQYETNTDTYTLNSTDYPWLDTIVKKMKRFASIMLIIGYLIHLRFKIADIVRGE